ncbi:LysR family transcriptional regulator [Enterobacteriaceae bacterium 89]|nr:LysR family transcriptional regulator [Enterobacteriaceae bacterium 89]
MPINNISLNSLKILNAVIEYYSVTEAAKELEISSSNISYALKKLRQQTGQPLFTRTRHGLIPDSYALALQKQYLNISALSEQRREFIITTYSPIELLLGIYLQTHSESIPFLKFCSLADSQEERLTNIRNRTVDVDIGERLPDDNAVVSFPCMTSEMCVVVSQHHSTLRDTFTLEDWHAQSHILWQKGEVASPLRDDSLLNNPLPGKRKLACESSNLLAMAHLCAHSDNIMMIPEIFVSELQKLYPLKAFPLPWKDTPKFECFIHLHHGISKNPNTLNLRKLLNAVLHPATQQV